jgi:hypothetical protein
MFSYVCEKCGREVPPAYDSCPDCEAAGVTPAASPSAAPLPVQPQQTSATRPVPVARPSAQARPEAPTYPRASGGGAPGWLIALMVGGLLILGGYVLVDTVLPWWRTRSAAAAEFGNITSGAPSATTAAEPAAPEAPAPRPKTDIVKYLQVTGLRIQETKGKPKISMVVVNHADAELAQLKANVLIRTTRDRAGAPPLAQLQLKLDTLGPNEVRDITMEFPTKLRAYELPDWSFLTAEVVPQ